MRHIENLNDVAKREVNFYATVFFLFTSIFPETMNRLTKTYNNLALRIFAIVLHALLNFIFVSYLLNFDISGSWIVFVGFIIVVFFLSYVFLKHLQSFIHFLINK